MKKNIARNLSFLLFLLQAEIPAIVKRKELVLELNGLDPGDVIRLLLTDTSFYSRGIDRIDTVQERQYNYFSIRDLDNLKNGPVYLEIYKEDSKTFKKARQRWWKAFSFLWVEKGV